MVELNAAIVSGDYVKLRISIEACGIECSIISGSLIICTDAP